MKHKVTPDLLARYLDRPATSDNPEDRASPDVEAELADLAAVAEAIVPLPPVERDPILRANGRSHLLRLMADDRDRRAPGLVGQLRHSMGLSRPNRLTFGALRLASLPAFGVGVVLLAMATLGTGIVRAATDSLPGDAFYPMKLSIEGLGVTLATSDQARTQALLRVADNRLSEVGQVSQSGLVDATDIAAGAYVEDVTLARDSLIRAESQQPVPFLATSVSTSLARQEVALAAAQGKAVPATQPAIETASAAVKQSLKAVQAHATAAAPTPLADGGPRYKPSARGGASQRSGRAADSHANEPARAAVGGRADDPTKVSPPTKPPPTVVRPTAKPANGGTSRPSGKVIPTAATSVVIPQTRTATSARRDDRPRNDHSGTDQPNAEQTKLRPLTVGQPKAQQPQSQDSKAEQSKLNQLAGGLLRRTQLSAEQLTLVQPKTEKPKAE